MRGFQNSVSDRSCTSMPEHYALIVGSGFEKFSQQDKGSRPQTRFGMPSAAVKTIVISAVREPGQIAVPDQILDYTWGREHTIYDGSTGALEHIEFTEPLSNKLRTALLEAARAAGLDCHDGGVYAATQGPRLETAAEVDRLERDGADFVGMTAMPEAAIAQELGLSYACLSLIVNRAAGRSDTPIHADVEASTCSARRQAESLLRQLFKGKAASNR